MSRLIEDYLLSIERKLEFDSGLALRAREDIEEYLHELAADERLGSQDALQRTIASFGDSDCVARQYAASGLSRQISRTWIGLLLAMAGAFVAMRLRAIAIDAEASDLLSALLWADRFALAMCLCFAAIGRLGYSLPRMSQLCSPRTAFRMAVLAIACSVVFGLARAGLVHTANLKGWPALVLISTATAEMLVLAAAGARVRRMDRYFVQATATD